VDISAFLIDEGNDGFWQNFMSLGYALVSNDGQYHALQLDALPGAGCGKMFIETASCTRTVRPDFAKALE
jgi:hypothetical protein